MTDSVALSVSVNGEPRAIAAGTTLDALVATLTAAPSGVAAAVNETVVPRSRWSDTRRSATATGSKSSPRSREADAWPTTSSPSAAPPSAPG